MHIYIYIYIYKYIYIYIYIVATNFTMVLCKPLLPSVYVRFLVCLFIVIVCFILCDCPTVHSS